MSQPLKKADLQKEKATSVPDQAKPSGAFVPRSSGANAIAQPLKQVATEMFRIGKAEFNVADAATAMQKPELSPRAEMFQELLASAQPSVRLGIISRCIIGGHDVHLVDEQQNILSHFKNSEEVPPGFEKARALVAGLPRNIMALVVFTDRVEALMANGSTVPYP